MENDKKDELLVARHSLSHVLAAAVKQIFGEDIKFGIGPAIETGCYYDFDLNESITPEHFEKIEANIKEIISKDLPFTTEELTKQEALKLFANQPYKIELINDIPEDTVSVYRLGDLFTDLCKGPHVNSTKYLKSYAYLIDRIAGAYWKGSEKNKMLQRIYLYAFASKDELKERLRFIEEAAKRDHRKLGRELDLFFFSDYAPGVPFFGPNGMILKNEILKFWREVHQKAGYSEIETPIILNRKLWEVSGHWNNYKENMYTLNIEDESFAIKPMSCPGALLYYQQNIHSYKEFPLRVAELGRVHRHEASGTLHGMLRVRSFVQDDAHIFITPSQITNEIQHIFSIIHEIYSVFGLTYHLELSTMPENHIGEIEDWQIAEQALQDALELSNEKFIINEGDGAFYGPKIDIQIKDAIGRTWQCGTIQLDMQMPKRFNIEYVDSDGSKQQPVLLHRTILGSLERFMGILTEHFIGAFPTWLAPVQVTVLNISQNQENYAKEVFTLLKSNGIRAHLDDRNEKIGKKIREAQLQKIPYMLIIGDNEMNAKTVSVRDRGVGDKGAVPVHNFINQILDDINNKSLN